MFNDDPETDAIIMIGEIGGTDEEQAAEFIKSNVNKPVVGFIAGSDRAPGQTHGPRRRDHQRRRGHRRQQDRRQDWGNHGGGGWVG
jgi:succinyl-CoA synthetase alpha subunit